MNKNCQLSFAATPSIHLAPRAVFSLSCRLYEAPSDGVVEATNSARVDYCTHGNAKGNCPEGC